MYEYDYKFLGASYGTSSAEDRYFAKVYQANTAAETLTQVRFFASAPMTGGISVIPEYTDSTSLVYSVNTSVDVYYPGWYTIDLSTPVSLGESGSSFAVIIKVDGSSNGAYMAYDSANTVDTGISFRSSTGNASWADDSTRNYCIKAITTAGSEDVLTGSVSVTGTAKVGETLTATVTGQNSASLTYQWQRGGINISGATSATYTPTTKDVGQIITCVVSSTDKVGKLSASTTTTVVGASGLPDTSAEDMRNIYMLVFLASAAALGTALIHRRKKGSA